VKSNLAHRLYRGEANLDVVGKRRYWYAVAGAILLIAVISFSTREFKLGIEFKGGNSFTVPASVGTLDDARAAVTGAGADVITGQKVGGTSGKADTYLIRTAPMEPGKATDVREALVTKFHLTPAQVGSQEVSGAWGRQITTGALRGVAIFVVLVVIYLLAVFREWRMPAAALAALVQNLLLTAAVYSLVGFEVTPSTVIGFLTILGFALYDVVVVFDKVRENTRGFLGRSSRTYAEEANLAVNQTLMRSINTAVVALLPVGGLLFIGAGLLGAGTLKDLGLVLFVGMLAAVYSSIFFATPVLVDLMNADPRVRAHTQRVKARRASGGEPKRSAAAAVKAKEPDTDAVAGKDLVGTAIRPSAATAPRPGSKPQPRKSAGKPAARGGQKRR
jgi:preprotein translocase subunit SecF